MKDLVTYLKSNKIPFKEIDEDRILINSEKYFLVRPDEDGLLFTEDFVLIVDEDDCEKYVYRFGGNWYWEEKKNYNHPKLNELKYIGECVQELETNSFLGIHGGYEILNGSRMYDDWCKKAKFFGIKTLGICEKNTLAGTLRFQLTCQKKGIKPILGATYTVFRESEDFKYDIKLFAKTEIGWTNLLMINKEVNVINSSKFIEEFRLSSLLKDVFVVIDPKSIDFDKLDWLVEVMDYYQLDTVEYVNNSRDKEYLENLKKYVSSPLRPISITDAYYLDQQDSGIKRILNGISEVREYESSNQYFKNKDDYSDELSNLFNIKDESFFDVLEQSLLNEQYVVSSCNFLISTEGRHLPAYEMTAEQKSKYATNLDFFWGLIEEGLRKKSIPEEELEIYLQRVETEVEVIQIGDVVDYFLILWDIIQWCKTQDILVGIGRGSSGGSLVAWLLEITQLNPLQFNLLFERFLNKGRILKSLPDIDTDFEDERKEEVKHYMEQRYGENQVCSVGTYTTFKLKSAVKDLSKQFGIDFQETNYITSIMDDGFDGRFSRGEILTLFKDAGSKSALKSFIKKNPEMVNSIRLISDQPKSPSIHPCATLILPNEKDVFEWIPVRKMTSTDGSPVLVTEWEGGELESAGFLKEDILGIKQLTKFRIILDLIRENFSREIDIYNLPLDDRKVFQYFRKGWNGDVFHFGSKGLTGYCKVLQPEDIDDLIAAIALFRPGAMKSNAHNDYILLKEGKKEIEYDFGLEEVTKKTYGLLVYQEQIMEACRVLATFTLVEADDIRKALGKMDPKLIESWRERFVQRSVDNGCEEKEAREIWEKLARFAEYGFNASHAAAYSITGYISQWLKVYYPTEFWTAAFKYASEKDIMNYISEINLTGDIKIMPADINKSRDQVRTDFQTKTIYWPFISIKQCGEKAVQQLIEIRDKDGQFFSFEEFLERNKFTGSKVTKQVIENLIMSGAFDEIENLESPKDRYHLILFYRTLNKVKPDLEKDLFELNKHSLHEDWWWLLQQKRLSGIAFFNYPEILDRYIECSHSTIDMGNFQTESYADSHKKVKIGGYIIEVIVKQSKKGEWCKVLIESNYSFVSVVLWAEQYKQLKDLSLIGKEKSILLISGQIGYDTYQKENILQTTNDTELLILS